MERGYQAELPRLAWLVRKKAIEAIIIYAVTIGIIMGVPFFIRFSDPYNPLLVFWFPTFVFTGDYADMAFFGKIFYGLWTAVAFADCIIAVITMVALWRVAKVPEGVEPARFYWFYVPCWFHFYTIFISVFISAGCIPVPVSCDTISPVGIVIGIISLIHLLKAKGRTSHIRAARSEPSGSIITSQLVEQAATAAMQGTTSVRHVCTSCHAEISDEQFGRFYKRCPACYERFKKINGIFSIALAGLMVTLFFQTLFGGTTLFFFYADLITLVLFPVAAVVSIIRGIVWLTKGYTDKRWERAHGMA
nr:hypothetical protein [Candidatus Sigynarchaeota archaeon]